MTHNNYQKLCGVLWLTLNETLFVFINKVLFWYWVSNVHILLPMHISVFESLCVNWSKDSHSVKHPLVRSCILCIERLYCMFIFCSLLWKLFFFFFKEFGQKPTYIWIVFFRSQGYIVFHLFTLPAGNN